MCVRRGRPRARGGARALAPSRAPGRAHGAGLCPPGLATAPAPRAPGPGGAAALSRSAHRRLESQAAPPQAADGSAQHGGAAASSRQAVRRGETTREAAGRRQASARRAGRHSTLRLHTAAGREAGTDYFGWDILAFHQTVQLTLPSSTSTRRLLDSSTDWAKEWAIPKHRRTTWRARGGPGCYRHDRPAQHRNE